MRLDNRFVVLLAAIAMAAGTGGVLAAGFQAGDKVEAYSSMSGNWEPATVQSVDGSRYFVHADNPNIANAYWGVTQDQLRIAGAKNAPPPQAAAPAPQQTAATPAPQTAGPGGFKAGDHVEVYSSMTGKWEPATIQNFDGSRYFVHADDPNIANAYWGAAPSQIRKHGAAAPANVPAPIAANTPAAPATTPVTHGDKRPEGSARYDKGADGLTHLVAIIGPGDEMPLGNWKLNAGGQSVLLGHTNNGDGTTTETHEWAGPENAGTLKINAGGTWSYISPSGTPAQGKWKDFGQNRIELDNYDGEVWTASTWKGELNMVNAVGEYEYGRRG